MNDFRRAYEYPGHPVILAGMALLAYPDGFPEQLNYLDIPGSGSALASTDDMLQLLLDGTIDQDYFEKWAEEEWRRWTAHDADKMGRGVLLANALKNQLRSIVVERQRSLSDATGGCS